MTKSTVYVANEDLYTEIKVLRDKYKDAGINFFNAGIMTGGPVRMTVNIRDAALGAKTPLELLGFAELLKRAADDALNFKYNGCIVTYDGE